MPIPSDFNSKAALLEQGALAYAAASRQPGQKAEDIVPGMVSWLEAQSDSVRTLTVTGVQERVTTSNVMNMAANPMVVAAADVTDIFLFIISVIYLADGASAALSVGLTRSSIEG